MGLRRDVGTQKGVAGLTPRPFTLEEETGSHYAAAAAVAAAVGRRRRSSPSARAASPWASYTVMRLFMLFMQ